ncbi:MAG: Flp pilus assembly protein CpaB [Gaiellaceae bacterium]
MLQKLPRTRNLLLPIGLATLAAVLVGIYVTSYRHRVSHGAGLVSVLVASRDISAGTAGSAVASGGYLKEQMVPRRAVVPGSIVSSATLTSLVASGEVYKGEQITLRQFAPIAQGGVFAKFSGNQRAISVAGDDNQLLAGTISDGDRVDVVATVRYKSGDADRASSRVVLRNLLVLRAPDAPKGAGLGVSGTGNHVTLVVADQQAQTIGWALKNASWFLALRPTSHPRNGRAGLETLHSFLGRGLPSADSQIRGNFPESVDGQ